MDYSFYWALNYISILARVGLGFFFWQLEYASPGISGGQPSFLPLAESAISMLVSILTIIMSCKAEIDMVAGWFMDVFNIVDLRAEDPVNQKPQLLLSIRLGWIGNWSS
ncbi:hypothetical protein Bca4012_072519 [Brassica carinata]